MDKDLTPDAPLTTEEKLEMATELLAAYHSYCSRQGNALSYAEGKLGSSLRESYKVFLSHVQEEPEGEVTAQVE